MKIVTLDSFIKMANEIHDNKYNYDKSIYINSKTKLIIICPTHGEFEQTPNNHLQKKGCMKCSNLDQEKFINKANKIHDSKYNYSECIFIKSSMKIIIICPIHGKFNQTASEHLLGHGCILCRNEKFSFTIEDFINKSKITHGDLYDYSLVDYINNKIKVRIICKIHGTFEQNPQNHINGSGCSNCKGGKTSNTEQFIEKAKNIHGDKYDYSFVKYINNRKKIIIICKIHGKFSQSPADHLQKQRCLFCNKLRFNENLVAEFLNKNNIKYTKPSIILNNNKRCYPDFYIIKYNLFIEYNGEQHYKPVRFGNISINEAINNLKKQKDRDFLLRDYCNTNKIDLLEIDGMVYKRKKLELFLKEYFDNRNLQDLNGI